MTPLTRTWLIVIWLVMVTLCDLTFLPYPPARSAAQAYFTDKEIDEGLTYSAERRCFFWGASFVELALLCGLALTGWGRQWADRLLGWTGQRRVLAALGMGLAYFFLRELLTLPIGIGRLYHARAWDMSSLSLGGWARDHFVAFGIELVLKSIGIAAVYLLMIAFPRAWWLLGAAGGCLLGIAFAFCAPLVIDPLFNDFTPLADPSLLGRVQKLCARADVPVSDVLVMNASRQSKHTNAYFTGFGSTRRIVLYDNLLQRHSAAEIESVLAHELGHWRHQHIFKGILLAGLGAVVGLLVVDRVLRRAIGRAPWQLGSIADPAGLPLILLLFNLGAWISLPMQNAVSRHFERQADQSSLELAGQPRVFIDAEIKLARDNKANVAPSPWNVWLFSDHPTALQRIRMAAGW